MALAPIRLWTRQNQFIMTNSSSRSRPRPRATQVPSACACFAHGCLHYFVQRMLFLCAASHTPILTSSVRANLSLTVHAQKYPATFLVLFNHPDDPYEYSCPVALGSSALPHRRPVSAVFAQLFVSIALSFRRVIAPPHAHHQRPRHYVAFHPKT